MLYNKIVIGCDHAGFALKEQIKQYLANQGVELLDVGCYSTDACSYPDIAHALCTQIQSGEFPVGILICGTGIGMSMCANKHRGIRAACCSDAFSARATRMHNDANVLCFGARVVGYGVACTLVDAFLNQTFEGERHAPRVAAINALDDSEKQ
ncbi:MAG: ribose 5-phosphate isomerase B [Clostridia bacterium]|jgi:ribose 5-phosphate isomerase B|nr:ribose 5-phosphate isomerase B [Clostridia bacterium]MBQ5793017.1 ribose 5-phosphate isomerase B [Clostridia bacterium]